MGQPSYYNVGSLFQDFYSFFDEMLESDQSSWLSTDTDGGKVTQDKPVSLNGNSTVQDAWNTVLQSETVPSKCTCEATSVMKPEPVVPTMKHVSSTHENQFEEMIAEEIVITSDDPFLCDVSEGKYTSGSSACSKNDSDERISDQGYESVDSPESLSGYESSFVELFPNFI